MQQPEELYELDSAAIPDAGGAAMLVHLEGFMDAGAAGRLVTEHLLDAFEHTTVARFDTDRLLDYRSRRPLMTFDDGRWESYDQPELAVHLVSDAVGKQFLSETVVVRTSHGSSFGRHGQHGRHGTGLLCDRDSARFYLARHLTPTEE